MAFDLVDVGIPVRFKTNGRGLFLGSPRELDGVITDIPASGVLDVFGEDGRNWIVLEHEMVCVHEVH
jgi:hypothetical protein